MATHPTDDQALAAALAAARSEPSKHEHWDLAEQLGEAHQQVDEVAAAYRDALAHKLPADVIDELGRRAADFHETWLGDDNSSLTDVLLRVLAAQPKAEWAFAKLTSVYTLRERWSELLDLYDRTLAAPVDEPRRLQLLEEAADIARDFASQADRAVGYMHQLLTLRPGDERLEASLERLLERQERWRDLVALWKRRLQLQGPAANPGLQARIAEASLDRLHDPAAALAEARALLQAEADDRGAVALLERLLVLEGADPSVRAGALDLLRSTYEHAHRSEDVIRVLEVALPMSDPATAIDLHREIAERLVTIDRPVPAMQHHVALLALAPDSLADQRRLRHLAETTGDAAVHVQGLRADQRASDEFAASVAPGLVSGSLDEQRVLLVVTPETPTNLAERLTPLLEAAGAAVTGQLHPALRRLCFVSEEIERVVAENGRCRWARDRDLDCIGAHERAVGGDEVMGQPELGENQIDAERRHAVRRQFAQEMADATGKLNNDPSRPAGVGKQRQTRQKCRGRGAVRKVIGHRPEVQRAHGPTQRFLLGANGIHQGQRGFKRRCRQRRVAVLVGQQQRQRAALVARVDGCQRRPTKPGWSGLVCEPRPQVGYAVEYRPARSAVAEHMARHLHERPATDRVEQRSRRHVAKPARARTPC